MPFRVHSFLPRVAVLVAGALSLTAGPTYAAGSDAPSAPTPTTTTVAPVPPVTVPDVRNQPFTFAKGMLEDAGFAWQVVGSTHGFPANVVVSQSPAPGPSLVQTGAPLITLAQRRRQPRRRRACARRRPREGGALSMAPDLRDESGFTLIELVVTCAMLGIVLSAITTVFVGASHAELNLNTRFRAQEAARVALTTLRKDARNACVANVVSGTSETIATAKVDPPQPPPIDATTACGKTAGTNLTMVTWCV